MNTATSQLSNRSRFISTCVEAGFKADDSAACWDKAIAGGMAELIELAQNLSGHGASLGGTEDRRRACSLASFLVLNEVRDLLNA